MEVVFKVPKKLERYIEGISEEALSKSLTILLELAIRNELYAYPDSYLEKNVKDVFFKINDMKKSQDIFTASTNKTLELILERVNELQISQRDMLDLQQKYLSDSSEKAINNLDIDETNLLKDLSYASASEETLEELSEEDLLEQLMRGALG